MPIPTEEELEVALVERITLHLERMERYDRLGKAVVSELGRLNVMSISEVAQSLIPNKLKLSTHSVEAMDKLLKKTYEELNGDL